MITLNLLSIILIDSFNILDSNGGWEILRH